MAVRRQRQRQLLLRHHAGVELGAADPRDGPGVRGAEGRVGGEGQGGEADLTRKGRCGFGGGGLCEIVEGDGCLFIPLFAS